MLHYEYQIFWPKTCQDTWAIAHTTLKNASFLLVTSKDTAYMDCSLPW